MNYRTFSITTLGCRVNHYESEQLATLLRARGLTPAPADRADVRIVHTCSVTTEAARKSRQTVRRTTRLPLLNHAAGAVTSGDHVPSPHTEPLSSIQSDIPGTRESLDERPVRPRVVVTGCWATSDPDDAARLHGVDAVLGHHCDVNRELSRLLTVWEAEDRDHDHRCGRYSQHPTSLSQDTSTASPATSEVTPCTNTSASTSASPESLENKGWIKAGTPARPNVTPHIKPRRVETVKRKLEDDERKEKSEVRSQKSEVSRGMVTLPQLGARQNGHQRAFLKVQDGCDAHCTYCIIPQLRPTLWSKPVNDAVEEARRLTDAGHKEIVLTGIFLGAYGHPTALRRHQNGDTCPVAGLVEALCTKVPGLRRLRLSSMEPLDLTDRLIKVLRAHEQVVPHFHLPLQSGCDTLLRRMNRQYTRDQYLRMTDRLRAAIDRPALTTDVIVGFPGETEDAFGRTLEVVNQVRFIHTHAFSYSPRPHTAAARWVTEFVPAAVANRRIERLDALAESHSMAFRRGFVGAEVEVLVERDEATGIDHRHGRCQRYFPVHFKAYHMEPGVAARVRIDRVTPAHTYGTLVGVNR